MSAKFNPGDTVLFIDRDGDEPEAFTLTVISRSEKKHGIFYDLAIQGSNVMAMINVEESKLRLKN